MTRAHDRTELLSQLHTDRQKAHPTPRPDQMCPMVRRNRRNLVLATTSHHLPIDMQFQHRDDLLSRANESTLLRTQSSRLVAHTQRHSRRTTRSQCATRQVSHTNTNTIADCNSRKGMPRLQATKKLNQRSSCPVTTTTSRARLASEAICQSNLLRL